MINGAGLGEDCAIFSCNLPGDVSGDSGQMVFLCTQGSAFPISATLQKCANILASRGAEPMGVSLQILLPGQAEEEQLKNMMKEAEEACGKLGMQITQAEAQATEAVRDAFVTATALGLPAAHDPHLSCDTFHTVKEAEPGQDIVLSKWIGLEGTAVLARRHEDAILQRYPAWLAAEAAGFEKYLSTVPEAALAIKSGACVIYNLSEGGIFAALWELAEGAGVGLTIDLKKIPIRQETVEICNQLNVNPYELLSGGSLLMTAEDGEGLADILRAAGIPAAVIGKVTDSNDRLILNEDEVRYLDRPQVDGVHTP